MKVSNIVISTVGAISMAGALGLAYAQSTYTDPQPGTSATTSQDAPSTMNQAPSGTTSPDASSAASQDSTSTMSQDATGAASQDSTAASQDSSSTVSQDSTTAAPEASTGSTAAPRTYNERVARADRN